jgi:hypothetical protein
MTKQKLPAPREKLSKPVKHAQTVEKMVTTLKMFHATVLVTRAEEWCVEAETAEEARELLSQGEGHRCSSWGPSTRGSAATWRVKFSVENSDRNSLPREHFRACTHKLRLVTT